MVKELNYHRIDEDMAKELGSHISPQEVQEAIRSMQNGKFPGPSTAQCVIAFTTLLARHAILLKWKHASSPSHEDWIREVLQCILLEKITYSSKGSLRSFHKIWSPVLDIIENVTVISGPSH